MADSLKIKIDGDDSGYKKVLSGLGNTAKSALGGVTKAVGAGLAASAAAITAIGTSAISAYADYEQLTGGVETLFKESSASIIESASNAFKTCGLSANEYMETVTSFSASLLQSVGGDTVAAAAKADQAIIDMSDNANKMGSSMESIQNAYQGFAKQNYTMLDNLKLGYGGTKEEMQRLLSDAQKISGIKYDISSFADITDAIHVIQTEMGITGTTALEASTTIQGSISQMKASWQNLMTGLTDPSQDFDTLITDFSDSVITVGENLIPRIQTILSGISDMIIQLAPMLISQVPEVVSQLLPSLISGAEELTNTLFTTIGSLVSVAFDNMPQLIEAGKSIILNLLNGLSGNADSIGNEAGIIIETLVSEIITLLPQITQTGLDLLLGLASGISSALPDMIPVIVSVVLQIVSTLTNNLDKVIVTGFTLLESLAEGIVNSIPELIAQLPQIITGIVNYLATGYPQMIQSGLNIIIALAKGLIQAIPQLVAQLPAIMTAIINGLNNLVSGLLEVGKNIVEGIWKGITNAKNWLLGKIKEWCGSILNGIKSFFGIHSPSSVMRDEVGKMIAEGIAVGINDGKTNVQKTMDSMNESLLESEKKYNEESERLKDSKEETDKKYLESLKDTAQKERKIYEALQKDIEESKKQIVDSFKEICNEAFGSIEEIEKSQDNLRKKLQGYGDLYSEHLLEIQNGKELKANRLNDLSYQNKELREYYNLLTSIKSRGNVPKEFFAQLRDMSISDALEFSKLLNSAPEAEFNKYINDWIEKQSLSDEISKALYSDEVSELSKELTERFGDCPAEFFGIGEESIMQFGEGFMNQLDTVMAEVRRKLNEALASISPSLSALANAGNTNNYIDNRSTVINANGLTPHGIIEAQRQNDIYQNHTKGW